MGALPTKVEILDPFLILPAYDERAFFNEEIVPLINAVLALCTEHDLPLLILAAPALTPEKQVVLAHALSTRTNQVPLVFHPSLQALTSLV